MTLRLTGLFLPLLLLALPAPGLARDALCLTTEAYARQVYASHLPEALIAGKAALPAPWVASELVAMFAPPSVVRDLVDRADTGARQALLDRSLLIAA